LIVCSHSNFSLPSLRIRPLGLRLRVRELEFVEHRHLYIWKEASVEIPAIITSPRIGRLWGPFGGQSASPCRITVDEGATILNEERAEDAKADHALLVGDDPASNLLWCDFALSKWYHHCCAAIERALITRPAIEYLTPLDARLIAIPMVNSAAPHSIVRRRPTTSARKMPVSRMLQLRWSR